MTNPITLATVPVFELIRQWASDRNIILGATPQAQMVKLIEEFSEITAGMEADDYDEMKDGLGDTAVVLTILAAQMGTTIEDCYEYAKSLNQTFGVFTDEADYSSIIRLLVTNFGKIATGIAKRNALLAQEGIGHGLSLIASLSAVLMSSEGETFDDALLASYNVIKDRTGKMVDGIFIKQADLAAAGIAE